ncbi:MAG: hypothetical protein KDD22_01425 [Bdellovibrionales bacterium]|nr:hypothetical protein [Bdellovibrionales bacterium]
MKQLFAIGILVVPLMASIPGEAAGPCVENTSVCRGGTGLPEGLKVKKRGFMYEIVTDDEAVPANKFFYENGVVLKLTVNYQNQKYLLRHHGAELSKLANRNSCVNKVLRIARLEDESDLLVKLVNLLSQKDESTLELELTLSGDLDDLMVDNLAVLVSDSTLPLPTDVVKSSANRNELAANCDINEGLDLAIKWIDR